MTPPLLNGLLVASVRLLIPAKGAWIAEVECDVPAAGVPTGAVVLTVGAAALKGTVDPRSSGRRGLRAVVQVVAGGGGWGNFVPALHLHNDFGVTTTQVYQTTASAVGEVVVDATPTVLGPDYVRSAGAASRVLQGAPWYVDASGITRTSPRAPTALDAGATVLDWDPNTRRAVIAADTVIWPGTSFVDARFGSAVARDIEQTFDSNGARAIVLCETGATTAAETPGAKLLQALAGVARETVKAAYLQRHRYRVVLQSAIDGRLTLQAVVPGGATPDILEAIEIWPGVAGVTIKLTPGTVVTVAFIARDLPLPPIPIVVGFDPSSPTPVEIDVASKLVVGGTGAKAVVIASQDLLTWIAAVSTATGAAAPTLFTASKLEAK